MRDSDAGRIVMPFLLLGGLCVCLAGITWGLPSARVDPFLFGRRPAWSGARVAELAGDRTASPTGADVDRNPILPGASPIPLNDTDAKRGEIVRRYRLFTYQPDEMITFMSLAQMRPRQGQFDPRLYQYGGLWIYPVGAGLQIATKLGFVTLATNQAYYLDHPDAFARFYVVARLYAAMWALLGMWACFRLARGAGAGVLASSAASLIFILLPVVVNMSHEAKPHLPGAVLILLAALAAGRFVTVDSIGRWILTSLLCGAAAGMILTGFLAFALIPAMLLMRKMPWRRRFWLCLGGIAIALGIYGITNPYVVFHIVHDASVLRSNIGNSNAMYAIGNPLTSFVNAVSLMIEGASPVTLCIGVIAVIWALVRRGDPRLATLRLLLIVAGLSLIQFILLAANKAGEYGRFAILPDIALAVAAVVWIGRIKIRPFERVEAIVLLLALTALPSLVYLHGFLLDSQPITRRLQNARILQLLHVGGARTIGVYDDPAPYSLPPVDLFAWRIVKLPAHFDLSKDADVDVIVRPVDRPAIEGERSGIYQQISERRFEDIFPSRISWANKPMEIWVRRALLEPSQPVESMPATLPQSPANQ